MISITKELSKVGFRDLDVQGLIYTPKQATRSVGKLGNAVLFVVFSISYFNYCPMFGAIYPTLRTAHWIKTQLNSK